MGDTCAHCRRNGYGCPCVLASGRHRQYRRQWVHDPVSESKNTGKPFERLVAAVQRRLDGKSKVTWHDMIAGRQIDVSIRGRIGSSEVLIMVECRDYADPIGIDHVDGVHSVQQEIGANKAIIVARSGFTRDALRKGAAVGIDTCSLGPATPSDYPEGTVRKCCMNIIPIHTGLDRVELEFTDGQRTPISPLYQLESDDGQSAFIDQIITGWLANDPVGKQHPMGKELHLSLTPPPRLLLDDEQPRVTKIHCVPFEFRGLVVESLWQAPEDWVFRRVLPDGSWTEEEFFRFEELKRVAEDAVKGEPIS